MDDGHDLVGRARRAGAGGRDVELVVALAEQDLGDLDVVEGDAAGDHHVARAVLSLAGIDRQRPAAPGGVGTHAQAGQVDRAHIVGEIGVAQLDDVVAQFDAGHPALVVGLAGVVEDAQPVGLPGLVDLVGDRDRHGRRFGRQHDGEADRTVLALGDAAFDDQRAGDA